MLNAASLSALDSYRHLVFPYVRRYCHIVCLVLYPGDVRARLEHFDRIRRSVVKLYSWLAGPFDPSRL